jgi:5-formyltetrahydrofolate cyclo-ligase
MIRDRSLASAPPDLAAAKRALRVVARKTRTALDDAADAAVPAGLVERFDAAIELAPGAILSGYWPSRGEIDPRALMAGLCERGHVCALPVIEAPDTPLVFRRWVPGDALVAGAFKIPVPQESAPAVTPTVLLVPLLAFDHTGYRLGYGGGYYDRTLAALRAVGPVLAIGLAYAGQAIERVPRDSTDQGLEWILTEAGAHRAEAS